MFRIWSVAFNSFREAVRDKILAGMLGFATAVLLFSLALGELSLDQHFRVVVDIGLATVSLFAIIVSVFLGSSLLYKEIEKKTLYIILPKPIRRHEFLLGKYFGIQLTVFVFIALTACMQLLVVAFLERDDFYALAVGAGLLLFAGIIGRLRRDAVWATATTAIVGMPVVLVFAAQSGLDASAFFSAYTLIFAETMIVSAVAILFSSFSTPFLTGAFTFGVWLAGRGVGEMIAIRERNVPDAFKQILSFFIEVIPNFHLFAPNWHRLSESKVGGWGFVAESSLLAAGYVAVMLVFAALIFRRRDFI